MTSKTTCLPNICNIVLFMLFIAIIDKCGADAIVYEFGSNDSNPVVAISRGSIRMFKIFTAVPLEIPQCVVVTYVNVGIHNPISSPRVNYDGNVNTVTISYRWYQYSASTYSIYAKGYRNPECVLVDEAGPDRR